MTSSSSSKLSTRVSVREFRPEDMGDVQRMLTDGLMPYANQNSEYYEFFIDFIEASLAGDLADIQGAYFERGGGFWVATASQDQGKSDVVVGMAALEKHADGRGEVRRVSTKAEYRRYGVGRLLMTHVEQWAREHNIRSLFLSTGAIMTRAQTFYESLGYTADKMQLYCEKPYYVLVVYVKKIA